MGACQGRVRRRRARAVRLDAPAPRTPLVPARVGTLMLDDTDMASCDGVRAVAAKQHAARRSCRVAHPSVCLFRLAAAECRASALPTDNI
jgi:hypothetical protein